MLDRCIFLDTAAPRLYQSFTLDSYPAEGDQQALAHCRAFVRDWDGHTARHSCVHAARPTERPG